MFRLEDEVETTKSEKDTDSRPASTQDEPNEKVEEKNEEQKNEEQKNEEQENKENVDETHREVNL